MSRHTTTYQIVSHPAERRKKEQKRNGLILTCTSPTQRDGPIDHPMGSLVHLFKVLREEDEAAVKVSVADVSTDQVSPTAKIEARRRETVCQFPDQA
jgi:hypothetical protein